MTVTKYAVVSLRGTPMALLNTPMAAVKSALSVFRYRYRTWSEMQAAGYRLAKFEVMEVAP